jgi:hypothetical protein
MLLILANCNGQITQQICLQLQPWPPCAVYTEDSGDASIEICLYDQGSDELLVVIRDKRRVGAQVWGRASTVSASADVRNLFNTWSNQLLSGITGN